VPVASFAKAIGAYRPRLVWISVSSHGLSPRFEAEYPRLLETARAAGAMVFYTLVGGGSPTAADVVEGLTPKEGEWVVQRGPDKFLGSPLEQRLKERGITTVIVTGTSAQGVGIGVGSGAAQRGYKVVVPVDGLASEEAFNELYAAYHLAKGGPVIVTEKVTLTRSSMIKF